MYQNLLDMFEDGQKIFRNSAATRNRFIYDRVFELIGGGTISDSAGYDVEDFVIPAGSSVIVAENLPEPDKLIYAKVVSGNNGVTISTTDGTTTSTTVYELELGVTFKDVFSAMGLDITKPKLQVTNPGTEDVVFRGGGKTE